MSKRISDFNIQLYNSWSEAKSELGFAEYSYQKGKADAIEKMKALIYQFDDYCNERECKYCWMNVSDDYSCLKQWINSKFEELKEQKK